MADYFNSPNAGQNRRAWLNGLLGSIGGSADYYLGPTGVPDRARSAGQIADMVSPVSGTLRSMDAAGRGNYGESALEGVGVLAPAAIAARFGAPAAKAVVETMTGTGNALADTGRRITDAIPSDAIYAGRSLAGGDMRGVLDAITPGRPAQGLGADAVAPGIQAYHGTPHEFPPAIRVLDKDTGKTYVQEAGDPVATSLLAQNPERYQIIEDNQLGMFDFSKMGTGEGAQAYGWGGYLAEAKPVAVGYRDQLSGNPYGDRREVVMGGKVLQDPTNVQWGMADAPDEQEYLNSLRSRLSDAESRVKSATPLSAGDDLTDADMDTLVAMSKRDSLAEKLAEAETLVDTDIRSKPLGQLYNARINADPEDFIDWDAPLGKQTGKVAEYISNYEALTGQPMLEALPDRELTGKDLYTSLVGKEMRQRGIDSYNESTPFASAYLNAEGIPGIRHLDANSRSAGDGTRNYVVFDENLINIVKKYGIAGAAAMLGASVMDVEQAMAQGSQPQQQPQGLLSMGAQ